MNACPPKPGLTDMIRTCATSRSTHSIASIGVCRVQHDARLLAELADLPDRAVQVRARLGVHADEVGAGLRVGADPALGILDHEMHVERQRGRALDGLDDHRADRQVRHEVTVHHVDVDVVGARRSRATSSARRPKSADRIEGAMRTGLATGGR